jgi:tRNA pseudouridine55 synthase
MNGILAVDKPYGWTSHDVVAKLRGLSHQRKIGHAGTLDPMATGVLLLCMGDATRLSDILMDGTKWYLARISFGVTTDTDDAMGSIVAMSPAWFDKETLLNALHANVGPIQQIPPSFAAIKRDGVPAYKRARAGEAVHLAARGVTIYAMVVLEVRLPGEPALKVPSPRHRARADVLICCSKGTYIRSIARDVGKAVGSGAHLSGLRRLGSGNFTTSDCYSIADLETLARDDGSSGLQSALIPADRAVESWRAAIVGERQARQIQNGAAVPAAHLGREERIRVYDYQGRMLALATTSVSAEGALLARPDTVFLVDRKRT